MAFVLKEDAVLVLEMLPVFPGGSGTTRPSGPTFNHGMFSFNIACSPCRRAKHAMLNENMRCWAITCNVANPHAMLFWGGTIFERGLGTKNNVRFLRVNSKWGDLKHAMLNENMRCWAITCDVANRCAMLCPHAMLRPTCDFA